MPPKKAAKKAAAKHADPKHHEAKDLRRAYEHLGRVEILQRALQPASGGDVVPLVALAEQELGKGHRKDAADLLRAAEHFSFAALAPAEQQLNGISEELVKIVIDEVEHLTRRAIEHWDERGEDEPHASLEIHFRRSLQTAKAAIAARKYRQALELARGAEALAHMRKHGSDELEDGRARTKLTKS